MDREEQALLAELDNARYFALSRMADWEEEHERVQQAKAWRWLRDHRKWPSKRKDTCSRYTTRYVYGWNFVGYRNYTMEEYIRAHLKGPANIPKIALLSRESPASVNCTTKESHALMAVIPNVIRWLKILESEGVNDFDSQYQHT